MRLSIKQRKEIAEKVKRGQEVLYKGKRCRVSKTLGAMASLRFIDGVAEPESMPPMTVPKTEIEKIFDVEEKAKTKPISKKVATKKPAEKKVIDFQAKEERDLKRYKRFEDTLKKLPEYDKEVEDRLYSINRVMRKLLTKDRELYIEDLKKRGTDEANLYLLAVYVESNAEAFKKLDFREEVKSYIKANPKISKAKFNYNDLKGLTAFVKEFEETGFYEYPLYEKAVYKYKGCKNMYLVLRVLSRELNLKIPDTIKGTIWQS